MSAGSYGCNVGGMDIYGNAKSYESPYLDFATRAVPKTFLDVIDWSEHVTTLNDDLGVGLRRLYTYFCTPLEVDAYDLENKAYESSNSLKWHLLLKQQLDYLTHGTQLGMNVAVYGNDFVTVTLKQERHMVCPRCRGEFATKDAKRYRNVELKFKDMKFSGFCPSPRCKNRTRVVFGVRNVVTPKAENIIIKHWPIRELEFDFVESINMTRVYWRIPNRLRKKVLEDCDPETLHYEDMAVLEAICSNKMLAFDDRVMFHAKEPHLSGLENRGLGIPRTLSLARQHWMVQLLKKQCQALAQEYVTPMRFFSLNNGGGAMGAMDPIHQPDARMFANAVEQMIQSHSQDPRRAYYVPFPVNFQFAGGGADQFVPTTLLQFATQELSTSLVPAAMLRGELNAQGAPMFLRMFEAFNREIPQMYNRFIYFVVARVADLLSMDPITCEHQSASIADNIGVDSMLMQAASMGKVSDLAWMKRLGLNPQTESNRILTEASIGFEQQKRLATMQQDSGLADMVNQSAMQPIMQAAQGAPQGTQGGDPSASQGPAGGGGMAAMPGGMLLPSQGYQPPMDVMQMEAESVGMAQLLGSLPQLQRDQELGVLRQQNQSFHHMVTGELRKLRESTALQARQMVAPTL